MKTFRYTNKAFRYKSNEQSIREYIKRLTEQFADVHVSTFERGEDLLKDKTGFDIVLLDISLNSIEETSIIDKAIGQIMKSSAAEPLMLRHKI